MPNQLVRTAALQASATSSRGLQERLFARLFSGLVYAQIWEDPEVDLDIPTSRRDLPDGDIVALNNSFGFGGANVAVAFGSVQ